MQRSNPIPEKTHQPDFLSGSGEMGKLIRSVDWGTTPLGSMETWSQSLRTTVSIMLSNRFPMLLWWGPEYISIYNDAYIPILGTKHPWALGKPVKECWSEIWHILQPLIDTPFNGGAATWMEDLTLEIKRHGFPEETHFTIAYSPVPDETAPNRIGGVLATVTEITDKVVGERRINILRDLGAHAIVAKTREDACALSAKTIVNHPYDIPFAMFYLLDENRKQAHLAGSAGIITGKPVSPLVIELDNEAGQLLPYSKVLRTGKMEMVERLPEKFDHIPEHPWPDPTHTAVIIPVPSINPHHYSGIIVAAVSSRLRFNESYKSFFELLTTQVATAIANAGAFEEERKRAETLEQIDKAKTIFFSNISHEFRTPLTLMLSPLEELLNRKKNNFSEQDKQNLETTYRNALRLLKLVNTLLDFSRIESGRQQASFTLVDIVTLTKNLAANFRSVIEKAGLTLILKCDIVIEPVYVDKQMWEKIVFNLLSNAFKYTLKGTITVELCSEKDYAVLKIKDTGVGIPENEIPHLFERFHRVQNVIGRSYEGTGIGLSLIKQLVQLHSGIISVESTLIDGSTFTVKIPFGKEHLTSAQIASGAEVDQTDDIISSVFINEAESLVEKDTFKKTGTGSSAGTKLPLVMVVDDNADMRDHLRSILEKKFKVATAFNGLDALHKLSVQTPDLILTDVMMPVMDGLGLLKEVKSNKATADIPVIFLTARAGEESKIEGWETGADDYLVKPFSSRELVSRIESHIHTKNLRNEAQQELQNIFRQAPVSIVVYRGKDFKVEVANNMALQMWGKNWSEVANKPFNELSSAINPDLPSIHSQVYKTGQPFYGKEFPARLQADGKERIGYFDFIYTALKDEQGKITGVVAVGTEVTESVLARKGIQESENRYRELSLSLEQKVKERTAELVAQKEFSEIIVNTTPDLIAVYDSDRRILEFNKACEDFFHLKKEDVIGKDFLEIFPEARNSQGYKDLLKTFKGEIIYNKHFYSAVTGRHYQNSIVPLKDVDGKVYAAVLIAHDITDLIEATETIKQDEEKFNKLFSSAPLGLTLSEVATGRLVDVNEIHLRTVGYTREEYLGHTSLELNLVDKNEREKILQELLKNGFVKNVEVNIRKKSGDIIPVLNSIETIFIRNKKYFLCAIIDISDRKKAEESVRKANTELNEKNLQLQKMNDELASFTYVASHDLQEPLRKIQTFSGRILNEQEDNFPGRTKDYFNRIISASQHMQNLIDALLNYSRTNTSEKIFVSTDLNKLLEDVKNNLQELIEEKNAVIISGNLPELKVIPHQFQQLLSNIISNSLKYSRPGVPPEVQITADKIPVAEIKHLPDTNYKAYWKISIIDNGIGFDQQYENKIFELFQRLHGRSEYSGTGVGLAICKKIVQNHNGHITAKGEPDKGAIFNIYLPIA